MLIKNLSLTYQQKSLSEVVFYDYYFYKKLPDLLQAIKNYFCLYNDYNEPDGKVK